MANFSFTVRGSVRPGDFADTHDNTDRVVNNGDGTMTAEGSIVNGTDNFFYEGAITDLNIPTGFAIDINGVRVNEQEVLDYYASQNSPPNLGEFRFNGQPAPSSIGVGEEFTVALSGVSDPDKNFQGPLEWDMGDGTTGTGPDFTHAYSSAGNYTITVTGHDSEGATSTKTHSVTAEVDNRAPTADFNVSKDELTVSVDASGSSDPDGDSLSYAWNIGGASYSGVTATHTFASEGTKQIGLTVTDAQGASDSASKIVTVERAAPDPISPEKPVAAISYSMNDLTVSFDGRSSNDPDGTINTYKWNFGDQTVQYGGSTVEHTYQSPGNYTVTLTVTDDGGNSNSTSETVNVSTPGDGGGGGGGDHQWTSGLALVALGGIGYLTLRDKNKN